MLQKDITSKNAVAGVLTPDLIADMKKEDMKQAIAERFSYRAKAKTTEARKPRSAYWQPVDDEC
jgi:hypothetical protein